MIIFILARLDSGSIVYTTTTFSGATERVCGFDGWSGENPFCGRQAWCNDIIDYDIIDQDIIDYDIIDYDIIDYDIIATVLWNTQFIVYISTAQENDWNWETKEAKGASDISLELYLSLLLIFSVGCSFLL